MIKKLLTLSLSASLAMTSFAQVESMEAFKHLGVGAEIGVMGAGIQFSMPVIDNHLVAVVGMNSYALYGLNKIDYDFELSANRINNGIMQLNRSIADHNIKNGTNIAGVKESLPSTFIISINGEMKPTFKFLVEWYPSETKSFHLTGGLMIGSKSFISLSGDADDNIQQLYKAAIDVQTDAQNQGAIGKNDNLIYDKLSYSVDHHTYAIRERVRVSSDLNVNAVKPYIGFGFGRSIPKKRVGVQFEMGAWYHGNFSIKSDNEIPFDEYADLNEDVDDVVKVIKGIAFWPQMTLRLTGRIF